MYNQPLELNTAQLVPTQNENIHHPSLLLINNTTRHNINSFQNLDFPYMYFVKIIWSKFGQWS